MQIRNRLGQFAGSYWQSLSRNQKQMSLVVGLLAVFMTTGMTWEKYGALLSREIVAVNVVEAAEMTPAPDKIEDAKWELVDELARCECGGHTWEEGFFRLDSNDEYSWGCLQFQQDTVVWYAKKLWDRTVTKAEAKVIALTRETARQLAYDVIWESDAGVGKDWVNCSKWHGLQSRVDLIKSLEK